MMEQEKYNYYEFDGWTDEMLAAHRKMRTASIYLVLLKSKAAEHKMLNDPYIKERLNDAERCAIETELQFQKLMKGGQTDGNKG